MRMQDTMKIWFSADIAPRSRLGASSDRYVGTVADEQPTPRPMISREIVSMARLGEKEASSVPMITTTAATMMLFLRPSWLFIFDATAAPIMAPTERLAVTMPLSNDERCQTLVMKTRTPEITPRS